MTSRAMAHLRCSTVKRLSARRPALTAFRRAAQSALVAGWLLRPSACVAPVCRILLPGAPKMAADRRMQGVRRYRKARRQMILAAFDENNAASSPKAAGSRPAQPIRRSRRALEHRSMPRNYRRIELFPALDGVSGARRGAPAASPVRVMELAAGSVGPLVGVGAEVVSLGLQ